MSKVQRIERTDDPSRTDWVPLRRERGYQLIDRAIPYPSRNLTANATFVATLDEAGDLIEMHGYGIRMAPPGSTLGNYIYPGNLRVVRT